MLLDLEAGEAEQCLPNPSPLAAGEADGPEAAAAGWAGVGIGLVREREGLLAGPLAGPAVVVYLVPAGDLLQRTCARAFCGRFYSSPHTASTASWLRWRFGC